MHFGRLVSGSMLLLLAVPGFGYTHTRRGPTAQRGYARRASHPAAHSLGQRSIDDTRATQIQTALAGAGYLQSEPTGHWDSTTESAMQRYQAANGWQTKLIPDSRAIIKLGLGPGSTTASTATNASVPNSDLALR